MDGIASYNRTWFDVRTKPSNISLTLDNIGSTTAKISVNNAGDYPFCKVMLTIQNDRPDESYQYWQNESTITITDLTPKHKYKVIGVNQCGSKNDMCKLSDSDEFEISFETHAEDKKH